MTDGLGHHFVLTLTRSGTSLVASLKQDSNAVISGTDATPTDEVALGVRSNASMDTRFDNIEVEYIPGVPEPASLTLLGIGAATAIVRRARRSH